MTDQLLFAWALFATSVTILVYLGLSEEVQRERHRRLLAQSWYERRQREIKRLWQRLDQRSRQVRRLRRQLQKLEQGLRKQKGERT